MDITESKKIIICRLCLEIVTENTSEILDDTKTCIVKYIPQFGLNIGSNLNVCKQCSEKIYNFYKFKRNCLERRNISTFESRMNHDKVNIKQEDDKCWFCEEFLDCCSADISNEVFKKCFPEMDNLEHSGVISCKHCLKIMGDLCAFISTCLTSEKAVKDYCANFSLTPQVVNLYEVYQFMYNSSISSEGIVLSSTIKLEDNGNNLANLSKEEYFSFKPEIIKFKQLDLHRKSTELKCEKCSYRAKQECDLKRHLLKPEKTTDIRLFRCKECSYKTKYGSDLKRHLVIHKSPTEVKMFKCDECLFETKHKEALIKHLERHKNPIDIQMFKCEECSFETKYKGYIKTHMLKHKNPTEVQMLKCEECGYETVHRGNLVKHLLKHKNAMEVRVFKCDECTYETKFRARFSRHLLIHKNPVELGLPSYEYTFETDGTTKTKMFTCEKCIYKTRFRENLRKHMLQHKSFTEVQMFKCEDCTYETRYRGNLKKHTLRHKVSEERVKL